MSTLPPEILSAIFASVRMHQWGGFQLPADKACLISCSQVCRKWKNLAQSFVYRTASLSIYKPLRPFLRLVQQFPEVAAHVEELEITSGWDDWGTEPGLPPTYICQLLDCLPRIHTLSFEDVDFLGWPILRPFPEKRYKLRKLSMVRVRWCAYESDLVLLPGVACTVFDFLSFVDVEYLYLSSGFYKFRFKSSNTKSQELKVRRVVRTRDNDAARPVVREIALHGWDPFLEVALMHGGLDKDALRSVTIYDEGSQRDTTDRDLLIGELLYLHGGSIRHLSLRIARLVDTRCREGQNAVSAWLKQWSISSCTSLETLCLDGWCCFGRTGLELARWSRNLQSALAAVLRLTASTLVTLIIDMDSVSQPQEAFDYVAPLVVQAIDRFPALRELELRIYYKADLEQCRADLWRRLPESALRYNILKLTQKHSGELLGSDKRT
ncbi:hypothetical protein C8Q79DRAFT_1006933 [Trametes meyenii]|nr:hypothetical protein C8Q79DRAFT_1006933 [Trametes meyenii]